MRVGASGFRSLSEKEITGVKPLVEECTELLDLSGLKRKQ